MNPVADAVRRLSRPLEPLPTGAKPRLPSISGIRAVVFDIYGTLLVSGSGDISLAQDGGHGEAATQALQAVTGDQQAAAGGGPPPPTGEKIVELLHAEIHAAHAARRAQFADCAFPEVEIREVWQAVLDRIGVSLAPQAIERLAIEYECRVNPIWPMPGLVEMLTAIREAGLLMGIVSNAQFFTPLALEALAGATLPELGFNVPAICSWSYEHREAKPGTLLYSGCLEGLSISGLQEPGQVLYIGNDMRNDVWPAQQCGMRTALFAGDARSLRLREDDSRVSGVRPDAVVTDLRQILTILSLVDG